MKYLFVLLVACTLACSSEDDPQPSAICIELAEKIEKANRDIEIYRNSGGDWKTLAEMRSQRDELIVKQHNQCE